jgi:CRP-like cAMP-binding protein
MRATNGRLIEGMIANLPIFRQAARQHLAQLAHSARPRELRRGETVCRRGERIDGVFALAYGLVKLTFGREDEEKVLSLIGPGETFGEEAVFLDRPSPIEATALADSMVILIPATSLYWLIDRDPRFARAMIASLSVRMQALVADVEAGALQTGMQRVAAYLDSLAEPGFAETSVHLPATKTVIAARLGITKETFSRLLHDLGEQKIVSVSKRDVALLDRTRLAAIAHGAETCPTHRAAQRAAPREAFDEDQHP